MPVRPLAAISETHPRRKIFGLRFRALVVRDGFPIKAPGRPTVCYHPDLGGLRELAETIFTPAKIC